MTRCELYCKAFIWLVGAVVAGTARAEDWPRWLGPDGDGTWRNANLPDAWPAGSLKVDWQASIGGGYAGLAVVDLASRPDRQPASAADNRIFTMDRPGGSNSVRTDKGSERVVCLNAADGKQIWAHEYPASYGNLDYPNGPRAMPTVDGEFVYSLGAVGQLCCLNVHSGKVVWSKRLVEDFGARVPTWGFSGAPLIYRDTVIVHVGAQPNACVLAFDKVTGAKRWGSLDDAAGYCAPIVAATRTGPQLVVWSPDHVHGIDPNDGRPFWKFAYPVTYGVSIATPLFRDDIVLVSGYWHGAKALALGPKPADARLLWEDAKSLRGLMSAPLYRDGLVYLLDKQFGLTCFELKTGKKLWDDGNRSTPRGRNPQASLHWLNDTDRVLILNSDGELIHARLTPQGYQELSRQNIVGATWCYPAFANGCIFARSDHENQIIRVRLIVP